MGLIGRVGLEGLVGLLSLVGMEGMMGMAGLACLVCWILYLRCFQDMVYQPCISVSKTSEFQGGPRVVKMVLNTPC